MTGLPRFCLDTQQLILYHLSNVEGKLMLSFRVVALVPRYLKKVEQPFVSTDDPYDLF